MTCGARRATRASRATGSGPTARWTARRKGGIDRLLIRGNVFRNIPHDGVQLGGGTDLVRRVTIEGNDFGFVRRAVESDHSDPIQVLGGHETS